LGMGAPKKKGMIVLENMQQSSKDHEYENYWKWYEKKAKKKVKAPMGAQLGHFHDICQKCTPPKCVEFNFRFYF
jgi:Fe-S-cluster-containing dehydrogenase component